MENLGEVLRRIVSQGKLRQTAWSNGNSKPPAIASLPVVAEGPAGTLLPECERCRGVGWYTKAVGFGHPDFGQAFPCSCQWDADSQRRKLRAFADLPHSHDMEAQRTFDNFDREPGNEGAYQAAYDFAHGETGNHILTLCGPNGTGKSHLLEAIGREMLDQGYIVKYVVAADLLDRLRESYDEESEVPFARVFEIYRHPDVLLLDDLGAEKASEWGVEKLYRLVEERYRHERLLAVGTNLDEDTLSDVLSPRIADRLFDFGTGAARVAPTSGKSYRTLREWGTGWLRRWRGRGSHD